MRSAGSPRSLTASRLRDVLGALATGEVREGEVAMAWLPDALAGTMGNQVAIACFDTLPEVDEFVSTAFALTPEKSGDRQ